LKEHQNDRMFDSNPSTSTRAPHLKLSFMSGKDSKSPNKTKSSEDEKS